MLVGAGRFGDGVDVHSAFVCEGARSDERLVVSKTHIGRFVGEAGELGKMSHAISAQHLIALFLEREIGDDGN